MKLDQEVLRNTLGELLLQSIGLQSQNKDLNAEIQAVRKAVAASAPAAGKTEDKT